jgi:tRNA U34 5-methylaminomethyl-2-thiouridine-forming methyltransferase MnmC
LLTNRIIQLTEDGSHTIVVPELNTAYHSRHGAIQESMHVFIKAGLQHFLNLNLLPKNEPLHIFEVGFGTGLNALLSLNEAIELDRKIFYETIEPYPLSDKEFLELNYAFIVNKELQKDFLQLHQCEWGRQVVIHPLFSFQKMNRGFPGYRDATNHHQA